MPLLALNSCRDKAMSKGIIPVEKSISYVPLLRQFSPHTFQQTSQNISTEIAASWFVSVFVSCTF